MLKFWKFMEEKGYALNEYSFHDESAGWDMAACHCTKQMLVGYMIEYLKDSDFSFEIDINNDNLYKELENEIKRQEDAEQDFLSMI